MARTLDQFHYESLPTETSFRVLELLPQQERDEESCVSCFLHVVDWAEPLPYEAISYAWGDLNAKAPVLCHGKRLEVTVNLHKGLMHLRLPDRSRFLWVDAICIDQWNTSERNCQVRQMRKIYQNAQKVLIWLGPDTKDHQAQVAIQSILKISNFICNKLGVSVSELSSINDIYQEVVFKNRARLPLPNECGFSTEVTWKSLIWFYSYSYFTWVWAIQEINANKSRQLHCGYETIEWDRVALVAGYIILETAFSKSYGFTSAYCWYAAIMATERMRRPQNWLFMLYLASNFSALDSRDLVYGLRGLMNFPHEAKLLEPDYSKSTIEVYRDSVEAAFVNFQNIDVLLYLTGNENPSWVPRWDRPMLFRNPFRFGKALPWKPAGETRPTWSVDRGSSVLSLSGFVVDRIRYSESYNEGFFGNAMLKSDEGRERLKHVWQRLLRAMADCHGQTPLSADVLRATGTSFSFGLDESSDPADEDKLLYTFVAYLKLVLDDEICSKYIPPDLPEKSNGADGHAFGKPVWDFKYPESSFFITRDGWTGSCVSTTEPWDIVCVADGSTYPLILRPNGDYFLVRGYAYVHGIMHGELQNSERRSFAIR